MQQNKPLPNKKKSATAKSENETTYAVFTKNVLKTFQTLIKKDV